MFSHPEELDESLGQAERRGQEDTDNLADVDELLHVGIDGAALNGGHDRDEAVVAEDNLGGGLGPAVPEPMAIPISAFKSFTFILAADKTTLKQCRFYQQIAQEK